VTDVLRVAAFEWRLLRGERTLGALVLLFVIAVAYASHNGRQWVAFERSAIAEARHEERIRLDKLAGALDSLARDTSALRPFGDPRNPYVAGQSNARRYALLAPPRLGALAVGQSDLFPSYYRVSMTSRETFLSNDEVENPVHLVAGRFDLAFVVVFLFPLVAIAITYNLISADREGGTLALLGSQPIGIGRVLAGKVVARGTVLVVLAVVLSFGGALAAGVSLGHADAWPLLMLWCAITIAYGCFWLLGAVVVNVFGRSSATNALTLLGLWLVAVVLIPSGLVAVVTALHPTPSRVELMTATREVSNAATARGSQLLAIYYQDHPELMRGQATNMNDFALRAIAVSEEVARATRPIAAQFDITLAAQQTIVDRWRFASPAIATHDALVTLAGTSGDRYREFQRQVDVYVLALERYFLEMIVHGTRFTRDGVNGLPEFRFREPPVGRAYRRVALSLFAILVGCVLAAIVAARASGRVSPAER
jgi:ABC-2 type transport system permease protein